MSYDGLPARAVSGVRVASADRRASSGRLSTRAIRRGAPMFAAIATAIALAACSGGASSSSAPSAAGVSTEPSVEASSSPSASTAGRLAISFQTTNNSNVFGGAILSDLSDGTTAVTLGVVAVGFEEPLAAVIQQGTCADLAAGASGSPGASASAGASAGASTGTGTTASAPAASGEAMASGATASGGAGASAGPSAAASASSGGIASPIPGPPFTLSPVTGGSSNSVIATTTSQLLAEPFAIVLTKSAADSTVVACADVTNTPVPSGLPSSLPSSLPSLLPSLGPSLEAEPSSS